MLAYIYHTYLCTICSCCGLQLLFRWPFPTPMGGCAYPRPHQRGTHCRKQIGYQLENGLFAYDASAKKSGDGGLVLCLPNHGHCTVQTPLPLHLHFLPKKERPVGISAIGFPSVCAFLVPSLFLLLLGSFWILTHLTTRRVRQLLESFFSDECSAAANVCKSMNKNGYHDVVTSSVWKNLQCLRYCFLFRNFGLRSSTVEHL